MVRAKDQALRALQSLVLQHGEGPQGTHGAAGQRTPSHPSAAHEGRSVQFPSPSTLIYKYTKNRLMFSLCDLFCLSLWKQPYNGLGWRVLLITKPCRVPLLLPAQHTTVARDGQVRMKMATVEFNRDQAWATKSTKGLPLEDSIEGGSWGFLGRVLY